MEDREREEYEALIADLADERDALLGKVRGRAHRDAAEKLFDELKVRKDSTARDDLYRLAGVSEDADEPDPKAIRARLSEAVKSRRTWALDPDAEEEPAEEDGDPEDDGEEEAQSKGEESSQRGRAARIYKPKTHDELLAEQIPNAYRIA